MPYKSEYLELVEAERESKRVAELLVYARQQLGRKVPVFVAKAAYDPYGDPSRLAPLTVMLRNLCREIEDTDIGEVVMYDGHNPKARQLAEWWEKYKEEKELKEELESAEILEEEGDEEESVERTDDPLKDEFVDRLHRAISDKEMYILGIALIDFIDVRMKDIEASMEGYMDEIRWRRQAKSKRKTK